MFAQQDNKAQVGLEGILPGTLDTCDLASFVLLSAELDVRSLRSMKGLMSRKIREDESQGNDQLHPRRQPAALAARPPLTLDFRRARLDTVLDQFYCYAGLIIRAKPNVHTGCMIDLCHEQPVTPPEALTLLKKVLVEMGCTLVQKGPLFSVIRNQDLKKNWIPLPVI